MDLATLDIEIPADSGSSDTADVDVSTDTPTADDSTDTTDTESDADPDAPTDGEGDSDKDKADDVTPNGKVPAKYAALFKQDKELRAMFFQSQEYKKHFATPAAAAEMLEQLDAKGGIEGINQTYAEYAEIDRMFSTGEKALLDKFLAKPENKAGFTKLGPALLDEFRKLDEGGWTHEIAKVMASTLGQAGMGQDLQTLANLVKDNPEAAALVKKMGSLVTGINKLGEAPPKPTTDPEREKLNKDRADFERSKSELFLKEVNNGIGQHIEKGIKESLAPYLKSRKLDAEAYSIIEANVGGELAKLMNADQTFTSQKDAVLKSGDKARIQKFFNAKISKYLPDAAKRVMRAFGGAPGTASSATAPKGTPTPQGVVKLAKPPAAQEIDYRKSGNMIMDSKAYLKSGRLVTWAD